MSSPPTLQQLDHLDRSSPDFHDQLSNVLYGEEYQRCAPNLQGDGLVWLVDYLDKALDSLDPSGAAFRKCLRELRSVCGTRGALPTSYTLSPHLLNMDPDPFASGGYGDVYEGTLDGSRVCIKRVRVYARDGPKKATKTFCQEAVMWKRLTHPNIVPLLGVTITPFQLISSWMSGGDLPDYIEKNPNENRLKLLSDVARGLCYLHSCNVVHGDLKGLNILVDDSGHARLADFGLATVTQNLDSTRSASCQHGHTARWAAPEVLNEGTYSKEADVFAFAMVMIEVFTGAVPFSDGPSVMAMLATTQGRRPPRPPHPTFTENLWTLMQRCWDHDPRLRPEVSIVLQVLILLQGPAWKRLTSHIFNMPERISLITEIFSDHNQVDAVGNLSGDDTQDFIDVIDEALDSLEPHIRRMCLHFLYDICGRLTLFPRSLDMCCDPKISLLDRRGFGALWKSTYNGRKVGTKVLVLSTASKPEKTRKRFCEEVVAWKGLRHPNILSLLGAAMTETWLGMASEWMINGKINKFVKTNVNADRLELLREVARGLAYMHDQEIVHGNLRGDNILIDGNGSARLAGFTFITITSNQSTTIPPSRSDETQWVDPVLLEPGSFGSKETDCFGLGVVIYEVLSGQSPFPKGGSFSVLMKALEGKRPERPQGKDGELFTDDIWDILELCWKRQARDRISASAALLRLEEHPPLSRPFFNVAAMASRIYSAMTGRIPIPDRQLRVGTTDSQFHHEQLIQGGDGLDAPGEGSKLPLKALKNLTIPGGYTL